MSRNPAKRIRRYRNVEDDLIVQPEATIFGPVTIGRGSVIGGNVWVPRSVPPGSRITQAQTPQDLYAGGAGI